MALFLVTAALAVVPVGAAAQDYSFTVDTSDSRYVVIGASEMSAGTFTVEVIAEDGPGGAPQLLYKEEHTTAEFQDTTHQNLAFENANAYDNITVNIYGAPSKPKVGVGTDFDQISWGYHERLATTGGDRDMQCDTAEKMSHLVNPYRTHVDCVANIGGGNVDESQPTNELEISLYQSAQNQKASADNYQTTVNNRLKDAKQVARIKGKSAYIRALNNGSSESAARSAAKQAVADYYTAQQMNLISEWERLLHQAQYINDVATNNSEISNSFSRVVQQDSRIKITGYDSGSTTETLANGTSVNVAAMKVYHDGGSSTSYSQTYHLGINDGTTTVSNTAGGGGVTVSGARIAAPTNDYTSLQHIVLDDWKQSWQEIDKQNDLVQADMDDLVNTTYQDYQSGDINNSDLVDPYVLSSEYNPGDQYQSWTSTTLALLGQNQPADMSNFGYMNVTLEDGSTYQGVLQSADNPATGSFQVNETYNPDQINGSQFLTTQDRVKELKQNFTVTEIRTADGQSVGNVTIDKKTYNVTNAQELDDLYDQLAKLSAELEARENNMNGASAGGGIIGSDSNLVALLVLAALVLGVAKGRDNGGRY